MRRGSTMLAFGDVPLFAALIVATVFSSSSTPAKAPPQRTELVQLRTETSRTYQNANGTRTTVTSLQARDYRGADGKLHPISTRLVPHGANSVINEAAAFRVAFDKRTGDEFVRIQNAGKRLGMTLEGARPATATTSGSTVRYRGVARSASLEYESLPQRVKETIVLEGPEAAAAYRFRLSSLGGARLRAQRLPGGAWAITDRGSRFVVEAPWAVDARGAGLKNSGARLAVKRDGADLILRVSLDRAWLDAPGRVFPVKLDPTIAIGPPESVNVNANCAACAPYGFYNVKLGTNATEAWRTALRFSLASVPADARVTDADVKLQWDGTCLAGGLGNCGAHTINAHRMTSGWTSQSTASGLSYDSAVLSSYTLAAGAAATWLSWDVTNLARDWHTGAAPNLGVLLKRSSESANAGGIMPLIYNGQLVVTYALDEITLYGPEDVTQSGATLRWSRYGGTAFAGYEVHRSTTQSFTPSAATRLATLSGIDDTTYADTSAAPGTPFYYKVTAGTRVSNEIRVTLPGPTDPSRTIVQGQAATIVNVAAGACTNFTHQPTIDLGAYSNGLVRFDLGDIPATSEIASATVSLWRSGTTGTGGNLVQAAPAGREWRESSTTDCLGDGATWTQAYDGVPWTTPGGDGQDGAVDSAIPSNAAPGWQDFNVTTLVKDWVAGRRANNGLRLVKEGGDIVQFASDDDPYSPAQRPKLEIVYQDPTPVGIPTAKLIAPRNGDRVRDTIAVEASAGDDRRVERVEFLLDGAEFNEDTTAPYAVNWDSRLTSNGSHTLRARAVDDAGNVGLSDPVTVDVANFAPPSVTLTAPPTGYRDTVRGDNPAGYWRLGESGSTMAGDNSGNARHGNYGGTYTLFQNGLITNDADKSVRLAAGSGSVTFSAFSGVLGSSFSAEAWIKHPGLSVNNTETRVVSRNAGATGGWKLGVRRTSAGAQEAFFNFGSVTAPIAIAPTSTSVYHLVGTYDGARIRLYLDGREVASAAATGSPNTTASVLIGGTPAADLNVDEVAVYAAPLTAEQVRSHFEVGQGRNFWVEGANDLRAAATPAAGRTLREVQFLVDDQLVAADQSSPYSVNWDTLAAGAIVPDGPHVVTARAIDDQDRDATTAPVTVTVGNNTGADKQAQITAVTPLPETLVDESGPWDDDVRVDIKVKNTGSATIASGAAVLRYRFIRPDGTFDDSVSSSYSLGAALAPGAERVITVTVRPPSLPAGLARSRMTLRFDLRDSSGTWWASRGNPPLDHSLLVLREGQVGLGIERYYHYDGEALGGGMTQLVNLASGNNIIRFSPFASPGRGLSTVVDLTYNAQAGEARGSAVGAAWWLSISSLSPFGEPLRCGYGTRYELKPRTCEELALEGGSDKTNLAMDLVDGDGTVHRFTGRRTGGRTFWREPQGVHLYLRQLEADEQPACNIVESGMQYTSYQSTIQALWAFTRPDGVTFYYQRNGWPTGVADRNGNCIDFELYAPSGDQDRVRVTEVVDAAGVANPAIRARRAFTLEYYEKGHHHPYGGKDEAPKVKAIRDHTGSKLSFEYYKDDRLVRLTQEGGTNADGLSAPSREWSMTYTRWWDDDDEETTARIASASGRSHPDWNIKDNSNLIYSVRDPRGNETKFDYYGKYPSASKAARLKRRTNRNGNATTFLYDTSARTTTVQRPLGRDSRYVFDAEGSLLQAIDKITATTEETTAVSWTADRHVFKVTEPTGQFTEFQYNPNGFLTKQWDQLRRMTELQYENLPVDDDDNATGWNDASRTLPHISQLTKRITPRGKQWLFDHQDSTGNLLKLTDPEGYATRHEYNADGTLLRTSGGLLDDGSAAPPKAPGEPDRITLYEAYDANGRPTKVTDPVGAVTRLCTDDDGLLRWIQDARHAGSPLPSDWAQCVQHNGRAYRSYLDYDPLHRMVRTSDPKRSTDPDAPLLWTHARYDANDNVTEEFGPQAGATFRDGAGNRTRLTYDAMDQELTETLFDFNTTLNGSNDLDRVEREETTQFDYDAAGRVAQVTSPRGVSTASPTNDYATTYAYDLVDRPLTQTAIGVGEQRLTHYCYDTAGDLRSITNPRANVPSVACGGAGAPAGTAFTQRREYTVAHELRTIVDPSGDTQSMTYDLDGSPAEHTDAEGAKVNNTYDGRGLVTQIVEDFESARRLTTKIAYDAVGNQKHLYSPRAIEAAAPAAPTPSSDYVQTFEYDGLDRPVRVLLPKQGSEARRYVHRRYDNVGNLTHVTVPVTESSLSAILANASETRRWVTQYDHFDTGWIRRSENQNGPVIYDYTPEGWQTSRKPTRPAGDSRDTFRTYYRDGLLETFADEKNNLVLRQWDRNGNLSFLKDSGVSSDRRPITLDIDHNGFDEVIATIGREENRHTNTTTYAYNLDGLVATRNDDREEDSQGGLVRAARRNQFTYDADGRVTLQEDFGRASSRSDDKRITQTYFATDRDREQLVEQWIGSDASGSFEPRQTTRREYFGNGLLRTLRTYGGSGDELRQRERHSLGYRDSGGVFVNGHRTSDDFFRKSPRSNVPCQLAADNCVQRWRYDGGDRLVEENDGHGNRTAYKLAAAGGIEEKRNAESGAVKFAADFDGTRLSNITRSGVTTELHYDFEGNLDCTTSVAGGDADCGHSDRPEVREEYSYDYRNRLSAWQSGSTTKTYEHDAIDRVTKEIEDRGSATNTRDLSYVGSTPAVSEEEERGDRTITRSYSYDPDGRRVGMSFQRGSGTQRELTYAQDPHGNVSMLINEAGDVKGSYGYTAYGEADNALTAERLPDTDAEPGSGEDVNPFRYSGKRTDATSGTVDMGARQFGPEFGQFLQEDRLDDALGDMSLSSDPLTGNRYALAGGNPVSFIEWDGHAPIVDATGDSETRKKVMEDFTEGQNTLVEQRNSSTGGGSGGAQAPDPDPAPAGESGSSAPPQSPDAKDNNDKAERIKDLDQGLGIAKDLAENKAQAIYEYEKARKASEARRVKPLTTWVARKACKWGGCQVTLAYPSYRLKKAAEQAGGTDETTARRRALVSTVAEEAGSTAAYAGCAYVTAGAGTVFGCPFVAAGGGLVGGYYGEQSNKVLDMVENRLTNAAAQAMTNGHAGPPQKTEAEKGWDIVKSFFP